MCAVEIHKTAIVSPQASLGVGVRVGAYAIVEAGATVGDHCTIAAHAQILPRTIIGMGTRVGRAAILGEDPQSTSFDPDCTSFVRVGERNVIREHVTIHRASVDGEATQVGSDNLLMVGCHLGHDTVIGDHNAIANAVLLAGHVELGNHTYLGGGAVFHQFVSIGDYCMVQGNGSFSKDIPHFTTAVRTNQLGGLNSVGLRRGGVSREERLELKKLYRLLFKGGSNLSHSIELAKNLSWGTHASKLLHFVSTPTRRGVCQARSARQTSKVALNDE